MMYGLDLSQHNGSLDFGAIKRAGNSFVILRAGYGWSSNQKDPLFETYYREAKVAGLYVGAYHYSYARNAAEAKAEADCFLAWIKGKQFEMPVYIDMEDADGWKRSNGNPSGAAQAQVANAFMQRVQSAGYYVGIYSSSSWFTGYLAGLSGSYTKWIANWGINDGKLHGKFEPMHQYTSVYTLGGKRFDRNVCYVDFPETIKKAGLNGFKKNESGNTAASPKKSNDTIAAEVIQGKWGNGADRKQRLTNAGYDYAAIQKLVNAKLVAKKSVSTLATEVIQGKWGNGQDRVNRLKNSGYDPDAVQKEVNKRMR